MADEPPAHPSLEDVPDSVVRDHVRSMLDRGLAEGKLHTDLGDRWTVYPGLQITRLDRSYLSRQLKRAARRGSSEVNERGQPCRSVRRTTRPENLSGAGTDLVIKEDRLAELVEASHLVGQTRPSVNASGLQLIDTKMMIDSLSCRRLRDMVGSLSQEERIDLLALGWLAQHGPKPGWEHWFKHTCKMVGSLPEQYFMGFDWAKGLELLRSEKEASR